MADRYDDDDDRPRRGRKRYDDDDDDVPRGRRSESKKGMSTPLIIGIVFGVLLLCVGLPIGLMIPAISQFRKSASKASDTNDMKQVVIAAHNRHDTVNEFAEGPYSKDVQTQVVNSRLSFRVDLLPYIEQQYLETQFRKGEGWDSAVNRPLGDVVIQSYASTLDPAGTATTRYRGFVGPGTVFEPGKKVRLTDITDGSTNTIYAITADDGVVWSKPDELPFSATGPLPSVGKKAYSGGTNIAMCDGSVKFLRNTTNETVLRALITRNGNEQLPVDW